MLTPSEAKTAYKRGTEQEKFPVEFCMPERTFGYIDEVLRQEWQLGKLSNILKRLAICNEEKTVEMKKNWAPDLSLDERCRQSEDMLKQMIDEGRLLQNWGMFASLLQADIEEAIEVKKEQRPTREHLDLTITSVLNTVNIDEAAVTDIWHRTPLGRTPAEEVILANAIKAVGDVVMDNLKRADSLIEVGCEEVVMPKEINFRLQGELDRMYACPKGSVSVSVQAGREEDLAHHSLQYLQEIVSWQELKNQCTAEDWILTRYLINRQSFAALYQYQTYPLLLDLDASNHMADYLIQEKKYLTFMLRKSAGMDKATQAKREFEHFERCLDFLEYKQFYDQHNGACIVTDQIKSLFQSWIHRALPFHYYPRRSTMRIPFTDKYIQDKTLVLATYTRDVIRVWCDVVREFKHKKLPGWRTMQGIETPLDQLSPEIKIKASDLVQTKNKMVIRLTPPIWIHGFMYEFACINKDKYRDIGAKHVSDEKVILERPVGIKFKEHMRVAVNVDSLLTLPEDQYVSDAWAFGQIIQIVPYQYSRICRGPNGEGLKGEKDPARPVDELRVQFDYGIPFRSVGVYPDQIKMVYKLKDGETEKPDEIDMHDDYHATPNPDADTSRMRYAQRHRAPNGNVFIGCAGRNSDVDSRGFQIRSGDGSNSLLGYFNPPSLISDSSGEKQVACFEGQASIGELLIVTTVGYGALEYKSSLLKHGDQPNQVNLNPAESHRCVTVYVFDMSDYQFNKLMFGKECERSTKPVPLVPNQRVVLKEWSGALHADLALQPLNYQYLSDMDLMTAYKNYEDLFYELHSIFRDVPEDLFALMIDRDFSNDKKEVMFQRWLKLDFGNTPWMQNGVMKSVYDKRDHYINGPRSTRAARWFDILDNEFKKHFGVAFRGLQEVKLKYLHNAHESSEIRAPMNKRYFDLFLEQPGVHSALLEHMFKSLNIEVSMPWLTRSVEVAFAKRCERNPCVEKEDFFDWARLAWEQSLPATDDAFVSLSLTSSSGFNLDPGSQGRSSQVAITPFARARVTREKMDLVGHGLSSIDLGCIDFQLVMDLDTGDPCGTQRSLCNPCNTIADGVGGFHFELLRQPEIKTAYVGIGEIDTIGGSYNPFPIQVAPKGTTTFIFPYKEVAPKQYRNSGMLCGGSGGIVFSGVNEGTVHIVKWTVLAQGHSIVVSAEPSKTVTMPGGLDIHQCVSGLMRRPPDLFARSGPPSITAVIADSKYHGAVTELQPQFKRCEDGRWELTQFVSATKQSDILSKKEGSNAHCMPHRDAIDIHVPDSRPTYEERNWFDPGVPLHAGANRIHLRNYYKYYSCSAAVLAFAVFKDGYVRCYEAFSPRRVTPNNNGSGLYQVNNSMLRIKDILMADERYKEIDTIDNDVFPNRNISLQDAIPLDFGINPAGERVVRILPMLYNQGWNMVIRWNLDIPQGQPYCEVEVPPKDPEKEVYGKVLNHRLWTSEFNSAKRAIKRQGTTVCPPSHAMPGSREINNAWKIYEGLKQCRFEKAVGSLGLFKETCRGTCGDTENLAEFAFRDMVKDIILPPPRLTHTDVTFAWQVYVFHMAQEKPEDWRVHKQIFINAVQTVAFLPRNIDSVFQSIFDRGIDNGIGTNPRRSMNPNMEYFSEYVPFTIQPNMREDDFRRFMRYCYPTPPSFLAYYGKEFNPTLDDLELAFRKYQDFFRRNDYYHTLFFEGMSNYNKYKHTYKTSVPEAPPFDAMKISLALAGLGVMPQQSVISKFDKIKEPVTISMFTAIYRETVMAANGSGGQFWSPDIGAFHEEIAVLSEEERNIVPQRQREVYKNCFIRDAFLYGYNHTDFKGSHEDQCDQWYRCKTQQIMQKMEDPGLKRKQWKNKSSSNDPKFDRYFDYVQHESHYTITRCVKVVDGFLTPGPTNCFIITYQSCLFGDDNSDTFISYPINYLQARNFLKSRWYEELVEDQHVDEKISRMKREAKRTEKPKEIKMHFRGRKDQHVVKSELHDIEWFMHFFEDVMLEHCPPASNFSCIFESFIEWQETTRLYESRDFYAAAPTSKGYADALRMAELCDPDEVQEKRRIPLDNFTLDSPQGSSCTIHTYSEAEMYDKFSRAPYNYDYNMIEAMWEDGIPTDHDPLEPSPAKFQIPPDMKTRVFLAQERWRDMIDYEAWVGWRDPPPRWRPKPKSGKTDALYCKSECGNNILSDNSNSGDEMCKRVTFDRTPPDPYYHHGVHVNFDKMTTDRDPPPSQYDHRNGCCSDDSDYGPMDTGYVAWKRSMGKR